MFSLFYSVVPFFVGSVNYITEMILYQVFMIHLKCTIITDALRL